MKTNKCVICGSRMRLLVGNLYDDRYGAPGYYSVYRCAECGFGRTDSVLEKEKIGDYYKEYYPLSSTSIRDVKNAVNVIPTFLSWLMGVDTTAHRNIKKGTDVLDVGSGSGASLLEIEKMGARGYGVEPDPNAQKIARKLKLNVFKGFLTDNPFPGRKFDYVTGSQVFEHEPDLHKFLPSAKNKLKKDGLIILSFPNFDSIYRKIFGRVWLNWHVPYHVNFFTRRSVEKLARRADLKVKLFRTITPNIWTVFQVRRLLVETKIGEKSSLWEEKKSSGLTKIINIILFVLVTPINRIVDTLGKGDSILIVLKNAK